MTSNDCEGAGETFRIAGGGAEGEFFGRRAYLTVSSQLHLEAMAMGLSRVYTLSPCFRAERSQTSRHLAEFWMLEAEWAFVEQVDELCDVVEGAIRAVVDKLEKDDEVVLADEVKAQMKQRGRWRRITYTTAIQQLRNEQHTTGQFEFDAEWGKGLSSEHERWLARDGPVFVTDYPAHIKPFYMRVNPDNETVACFDLLVPGVGELVGGSLREDREHKLLERMAGMDLDSFQWYVDLRRYGGAPHGGFGLGFERLIAWLAGIDNIRECIPFPRWTNKLLL